MARFLIVGGGPAGPALSDALEAEGHVVSVVDGVPREALEHVAIVCWLERSSPERLLLSAIDSSMRGLIYQVGEPADEWEPSLLAAAERNSIPVAPLRADPGEGELWLAEARAAISQLIDPTRYAEDISKSRSTLEC